jgi:hypothetical protein
MDQPRQGVLEVSLRVKDRPLVSKFRQQFSEVHPSPPQYGL